MTPNTYGLIIYGNCIITKYSSSSHPKTNYTITAKNAFGETTVIISITISDKSIKEVCEDKGYAYITSTMRVANYKTMKMSIFKPDGTVLTNWEPNSYGSDYEQNFCVPQGKYKATFTNPLPLLGWNTGYIQLSLYDTPLGKYSLKEGEVSKSTTRNCIYNIIFVFIYI